MDTSSTDPDKFVQKVTNPWRWFTEAEGLLLNSDIFWNRAFRKLGQLSEVDKSSRKYGRLSWRTAALLKSALLLAGLSLENTLKGHLIDERPEDVELESKMDGTGTITDVKFTKVGDNTVDHRLKTLAHESNLLNLENNQVIQAPEDLSDYEKSLLFLEKIVTWYGRYPAPLRYRDQRELKEEILPDEKELDFYAETYAAANDTVLFLLPDIVEQEIKEQGGAPMTKGYKQHSTDPPSPQTDQEA